ncbi:coatomer subunit zeta-1-like [Canna indica]|uniref:Coatomer subunit zeta n=1 Tax=Canna indica TaxID=4628 RepID=A0AAQ3QF37_9LILI|nr:coatomer subunit zeta-1-like [Canna indica]
MESCPAIKNILLLDSEGKRVAVKYYTDDWPTLAAKLAFEKSVFTKTLKTNSRTEADITILDGYVVVYKFIQDLHFFVTGGDDENELIIATVLQGFFDAVGLLLRHSLLKFLLDNVDKISALENLDLILLCLDEIVDGGIILETDASVIASKVAANGVDGSTSLSEQRELREPPIKANGISPIKLSHMVRTNTMYIAPAFQLCIYLAAAMAGLLCIGFLIVKMWCLYGGAFILPTHQSQISMGHGDHWEPAEVPTSRGGLPSASIRCLPSRQFIKQTEEQDDSGSKSDEQTDDSGRECSICFSEFQHGQWLRPLPNCPHVFHLPCIDHWLQTNRTCPLCRANVLFEFEPVDSSMVVQMQTLPRESIRREGRGSPVGYSLSEMGYWIGHFSPWR